MNTDYYAELEAAGHKLIRNDKGEIDDFQLDFEDGEGTGHNGPRCMLCDETWCIHCGTAPEHCVCDVPSSKFAQETAWWVQGWSRARYGRLLTPSKAKRIRARQYIAFARRDNELVRNQPTRSSPWCDEAQTNKQKRHRCEWLTQCGRSIAGKLAGIGCGKFLPASNWMRRDGMDSRGGAFGNAPLCSDCSEK